MKKNYLLIVLAVVTAFYDMNVNAQNTKLGNGALRLFRNSIGNTAIGLNALSNNNTGIFNTATGSDALQRNISGRYNTAYGVSALFFSAGSRNTALGSAALIVNNSFENTAIGASALYSNTNGSGNTANGNASMTRNRIGNGNTANGYYSMNLNHDGYNNTANGFSAMYSNISGNTNTANGYASLYQNTGSQNIAFGFQSLYANLTGSQNTAIGNNANVSLGNLTNATAIGNNAIANGDNKVVIGRNMTDMIIGGYADWSNFSDGRFKENIKEDVPGLKFISKLHPVTYTINTKRLDEHISQNLPDSIKTQAMQKEEDYSRGAAKIQTGFVAQEVEKTAKRLGYNFDGVNVPKNPTDNYSIAYSQFVMPLVKTVQELAKMNTEKDIKITSIQKQLDDLKKLAFSIDPKN